MKRFLLAVITALFFAAPASAAFAAGFNITDVIRATPEDLAAALADATARNDTFAMQCYSGTAAYNAANPQQSLNLAKPAGVVSAFQTARDVVKGVSNVQDLVPKELVLACGPLALDVQNDLARAAANVAGFTFLGIKF